MVQRSEHADRVLDLARAEADWFGHRYLGPEHLLLGLLAEGHNRAPDSFGPLEWSWPRPGPRWLA